MKPYLQPILRTLAAIAALGVFTSVTAFAQTTLYSENFTYSNGTTSGSGNPAKWTTDVSGTSPNPFSVQSNIFTCTDIDGEAEWYSQVIYIQGWSSVSASVYLPAVVNMGSTDYMKVYYKLDGGAETFFPTNGNLANNYTNLTASVSGLTGSTLQIVIKVTNQDADETHYFDNVTVTGTGSGSLYSEDFSSYSSGTTTSSKWTISSSGASPTVFSVQSGRFQQTDADGEVNWTSSVIDISGCTSASASVYLQESGTLESTDYIRVYYKLNGGSETYFTTNGNNSDDFGSRTASVSGLSGSTLQIVIRTTNSYTDEYHYWDDITVTGTGCTVSALSLSTTGTNIDCSNPSGAVNLTVTGGQAPFTFSWSNSATTEDLSSLSAGTYAVTVTGNTGATATTSRVITNAGTMSANAVVTSNYNGAHVSCPGSANGAIDLSVSGGTSPYTYSWTDGTTTQDLSNKAANAYNVTVTDAQGCTATTGATINNPTALNPSTSVTNATCPTSSNGALNLTVTGGTGSKTYQWSSGQTTEDVSSLIVDDYSVTVTDANGCTASTTGVVGSASTLSSSMSITHVSTPGGTNGAITQTVTGGSSPYTYLWSNGATTKDISSLAADVYVVTITDNASCQLVTSGAVTEKATLFCENFSYADGTTTSANWTQSCGSCSVGADGDWEVISNEWRAADLDAKGTWTSKTIDISGYANVTATVDVSETGTQGGDDYIRVYYKLNGGSNTYFSTNGNNTDDIPSSSRTATQSGLKGLTLQIVIEVDVDNGAANYYKFDNVCVTGEAVLGVAFSQANVTCNGSSNGSIDMTVHSYGGMPPYTYSWSNGAATQDLSGLAAGTYTVTVTDNSGTGTYSQEVSSSSNDADQDNFTGLMNTGGSNLNLVSSRTSGIRFTSVSVPKDATINSAYLTFMAEANNSGSASFTIKGEATDDASSFSIINWNITGRGTTSASVTWSGVPDWTAGSSYQSPNIASIISELTSRSGWASGNDIAIIVTASGTRKVATQNHASYNAPTLVINYSEPYSKTGSVTITEPTAMSANITPTNTSCPGSSNGAANLTVTGGSTPRTYLWSNGITLEDLSGLKTGTYSVTVTGAMGCTATASTTISSTSNISTSFSITDATSLGGTDGAINQTVSGGVGPYSYSWSNGATSEDISNVAAGVYTVTITDASGCTFTKTGTIHQLATISCQDFSAYSNGTTSGSWTQSCSGCTQINWDVQSAQWAAYDIDAQGVWTSSVINISGYGNVRLSVDLSEPDVLESNDYIRVYYKLDGGAETQFATNGNMTDDFGTATALQTGLSGSTVQIVIRVWNDAEHHYFDNVCVTGYSPFYTSLTTTNVSCFGAASGEVDLTVTNNSGTLPFSYNWSNGATSEDLTGVGAGAYTVTVTDAGGLTATGSATVTQPASGITVNNTIVNVTCHGGSDATIILAVSGGTSPYSFLWSNGSTSMNPSGLTAGTYTVTITQGNGCTTSNNYVVTSPSLPLDMTYTGTASFCSGGSTQLVASGAQSFSWTPSTGLSAANIANPVINPGSTTTYYVTASSPGASNLVANGNFESGNIGFTTQYAYTTNNLVPEGRYGIGTNANTYHSNFFSSGDHTSGSGKFMIINGAVTMNMKVWCQNLNVQQGASYAFSTWISSVHPSNPAQLEFSINGSLLGTAITAPSVRYQWNQFTANWTSNTTSADFCIVNRNTVAGGNDFALDDIVITPTCSDVDTITVTVNTVPTAVGDADGGANQSICYGGTAQLEASGGGTYSWSNGATTAANNVSPTSNTTYTVTVTSAQGCSATDNVNVTVHPQLTLTVDSVKNTVCVGGNSGYISISVSGGGGGYNYSWSNGATSQDVTGLSVGTYTVTVTDANNCTVSTSRTITDVSIDVTLNKTDISCNNAGDGSISVSASGGAPPYSYLWSTGAGAQSIAGLSAGNFSVTVTGSNSCTASGSAAIINPAALTPSAAVTDITCSGLTNGAIDASVSGGWTPYSYNWGGGITTQDRNALAPGLYTVTVTDARSCTATLPKLVMNAGKAFSVLALTGAASSTFPTGTISGGFYQTLPASGSENFTFTFANSYLPSDFTLNSNWAGTGTMTYTKNDANAASHATFYSNSRVTEYHDFNPGDVGNQSGNIYRMYGRGLFAFNGSTGGVNHSWTATYNFSGLTNGYLPAGTLIGFTDIDGNPETALLSAVLASGSGAWLGAGPFDYTTNSTHGQPTYNAGANTYYFDGPSVNNGAIMYFTTKNLTSITLNLTAGNGGGSYGIKFAAPASAPLATSKSITNVLCNGASTGAVDLTVIGGTSPYTYAWALGATTQDLTNKPADEYHVTVTDANGCTKSDSATITQPAAALSASLDITDVTCMGLEDGTVTINVSGGTSPYTRLGFAGYIPGPVDSNSALLIEYVPGFIDSLSPLALTFVVTDSNGCSVSVSGDVSSEGPVLSFSTTNVNCSGDAVGAIDLTVSGESPFTYAWSNAASTEDISGLIAGSYEVTVTDSLGCLGVGDAEVTAAISSNITSTLTVTDVTTTGGMDGAITQSVSGGTGPYLYNWSNSASTMNISGLTSGSYSVTITDANGCSVSFSAIVEEPSACPCTWLGTQNNAWGNAGNWDCGFVPTDTCDVVIPSGTPFTCGIQANAACRNLTIQPGATLIIVAANQIDITGNFSNDGVFTRNNSVVRFTGNTEQHINGMSQTDFWNIHISNSSSTGVRMHKNIGVYGDLRLLDGYLYTGPDTVKVETISQSALLMFGPQSFVVGKIRRKINNAGDHGYEFPVGDAGSASRFFRAYIKTHNLQGTGYLTVWFDTLRNHSDNSLETALVNPPTDINNYYNYNVPVVTVAAGDTTTTTNYNLLGGITGGITGWLNQNFTIEKAAEEDGIAYTYIAPEGEWKFEPDQQPTGGFYDMILYVENMSGLSDNNFGVLKRPTGSDGRYWSGGGGIMNPFNGPGRMLSDGYAMRMMLTTFSGGGAGGSGGGGGLPIELIDFKAELVGEQVELTWVTATEINNEYFTIEKSDGNEFRQVAIVPGAGNSSVTRYYSRIDYDPFEGVSYYRLKQTDYDGKFEYSHVVSVTYVPSFATDDDNDVLLFPNPSTGDFSLVLKKASEMVTLLLFDAKGSLLKTIQYSAPEDNYPYSVSIDGLPDGIYYLKVDAGANAVYTKKVMLVGKQ